MSNLQERKNQLQNLVKKFDSDINYYLSNKYNESQLRTDFLDEFFTILGWDITNKKAASTNEREVLVEEGLKSNSNENTKKPDYTFRLFSERKFFVEAKKPSVDVSILEEPSKQIRRYGFTAKLKISVLSNFEYTAIYDCSTPVNPNDQAQHSRIRLYHYTELVDCLEELEAHIGRESVYNGSFDEIWSSIEDQLLKCSIDDLFLKQINDWRLLLATEFVTIKPELDELTLNDLVQSYINSIVFLRVCEDRNLEDYETLYNLTLVKDHNQLIKRLKTSDQKYNSGLFSLKYVNEFFKNENSIIWEIIKQLYFPESIYSFSVFSSDILGNIYEVFLSKKIKYINGILELVNKPDNIDRDVVTTPNHIIKEILRKTIIENCENKNSTEILSLKLADIACGSGAFLLEAFQVLQDLLIDYYIKNDKTKLISISQYNYKLSYQEKKEILCNCIYGFDKDYNAVNACRFGLLLKLLENESKDTIINFNKILPTLDQNIVHANSLIDFDDQLDDSDIIEINPYNLHKLSFDIIVGNPPYMTTEHMNQLTPKEFMIYKKKFKSAYKQFDKYFLFLERSLALLKPEGCMGYILPSKFMKIGSGKNLRKLITSKKAIYNLYSFGSNQIFKNKTTYTCLIFLKNKPQDKFIYQEVKNLKGWIAKDLNSLSTEVRSSNLIGSDTWILEQDTREILHKMSMVSTPLMDILGKNCIANGIQTSANKEYIHKPLTDDGTFITFDYRDKTYKIEKALTRPYYETVRNGSDNLYTYKDLEPNRFVIFPYKKANGQIKFIKYDELETSYPFAFKYLNDVKSVLADPKRDIKPEPTSINEWYRYGRSQALENCEVEQKIIVGILSQGYKYCIDRKKTYASSGGTAGYNIINVPTDSKYSIYYIQALLSSRHLEWFASIYGEVFRGGFIARGTKIQNLMLIPTINFDDLASKLEHDKVSQLQQKMNSLYMSISTENDRTKAVLQRQFEVYRAEMDALIAKLYDLDDLDKKIPSIEDLYKNL